MIFGYGCFEKSYVILCISREGTISLYLQNDKNEPSEEVRLNTRVVTADMSFPDFAIATADNVVSLYAFSNSNFKISVPKFSIKMA